MQLYCKIEYAGHYRYPNSNLLEPGPIRTVTQRYVACYLHKVEANNLVEINSESDPSNIAELFKLSHLYNGHPNI